MEKQVTKISFIILITLLFVACNSTKRVPKNKRLLTKTEIIVDGKPNKIEEVANQVYQKPNSSLLGYRLRLNIYNLAKQKPDSIYQLKLSRNQKKFNRMAAVLSRKQVTRLGHSFFNEGIHNFLKNIGEPPVIADSNSTKKSVNRLKYFYFQKGYFNVKSSFTADSSQAKKISLKYTIDKGTGFIIDSLKTTIGTPALDSIYQLRKKASFIKLGNQYLKEDLDNERSRITTDFRNHGAYFFQENYIGYSIDTLNTNKKVNLNLDIKNQNIRVNDTSSTQPFILYKINKINIYTDQSTVKNVIKVNDSVQYNGINFYSEKKLKYKPKSIVNSVFITPGSLFSDQNTALTSKYLSNLRVFNSPTIQYTMDSKSDDGLIANIFLQPKKKYIFNAAFDFIHSNIQDYGVAGSTSLQINNVFNGAETFSIGLRGNVGASRQLSNVNNTFFNQWEYGIDSKLNFPRILFPIKTDKIIPKKMIPYTSLGAGYSKQTNIGLDKQGFNAIFAYNWTPKRNETARYELFNIQFIKNFNVGNYYNIYQSSYDTLNAMAQKYGASSQFLDENGNLTIDSGIYGFILNDFINNPNVSQEDAKTVLSVLERQQRLVENNLILSSSFSFSKTSKKDIHDDDFYSYKYKIETAGNLFSLLAKASKELDNKNNERTIFEVAYSQYAKAEGEFIKHWDLGRKKVFAVRAFYGLAIPYGNSGNIPFTQSYFSGGTNDIRAWQPYSLGPGSSGGIFDFNVANMKFTANAEFRFNIFNNTNGALFVDTGNIWNVLDDTTDEEYKFTGFKSLETIAIGTGFGIRQDFGMFVVRLDFGFKTYNPANDINERWLKDFNLKQTVVNIGINYPF